MTFTPKTALVKRFADQQTYSPNHHTGTINCRFLDAGETAHDLTVVRGTLSPDGGADYHVHHHSDQLMFVISGSCIVTVEGTEHEIAAGDMIFLPRAVPHGVRVTSRHDLQLHITYLPSLQDGDTHSVE